MINLKTVKQMENAPVEERLEIIELLQRSLKKDMAPKIQLTKIKPFIIRQFNLGQEYILIVMSCMRNEVCENVCH